MQLGVPPAAIVGDDVAIAPTGGALALANGGDGDGDGGGTAAADEDEDFFAAASRHVPPLVRSLDGDGDGLVEWSDVAR